MLTYNESPMHFGTQYSKLLNCMLLVGMETYTHKRKQYWMQYAEIIVSIMLYTF